MFFNVVILKFILMITAPYVFQRCDFDRFGDDCKKPNRCKKPTWVFCNLVKRYGRWKSDAALIYYRCESSIARCAAKAFEG